MIGWWSRTTNTFLFETGDRCLIGTHKDKSILDTKGNNAALNELALLPSRYSSCHENKLWMHNGGGSGGAGAPPTAGYLH
jgi:hypothetical protein